MCHSIFTTLIYKFYVADYDLKNSYRLFTLVKNKKWNCVPKKNLKKILILKKHLFDNYVINKGECIIYLIMCYLNVYVDSYAGFLSGIHYTLFYIFKTNKNLVFVNFCSLVNLDVNF